MLQGLNTQWLQFSMISRADFDPRSPDRATDIVDVRRGPGFAQAEFGRPGAGGAQKFVRGVRGARRKKRSHHGECGEAM